VTIEEQLIRDEGLRLKPYTDTVGKTTIGVGRNLTGQGISEAEAMAMLESDIAANRKAVLDALPWTAQLPESRLAVLVEMAFNLGPTRLLNFEHMLAAIEKGDYTEAAKQGLDSLWARQVGQRANRLMRQLETGEWT
jgi:lysozyme